MATGLSLHIGINFFDPNHYGYDGRLNACEADAKDMSKIAEINGFKTALLLSKQATRSSVIDNITRAANSLKPGDIFFLTYSGHGSQKPDFNSDEDDNVDETWCLYDGELIDDELYNLWSKFKNDVRVLVVSDSCHSGTIAKNRGWFENEYNRNVLTNSSKTVPLEVMSSTYLNNKDFYDKILSEAKPVKNTDIQASVKLISACQDNQVTLDGAFNGLFTGTLKNVWNGGKFKGDYWKFQKEIKRRMPPDHSPNYFNIGKESEAFDNQIPFAIETASPYKAMMQKKL